VDENRFKKRRVTHITKSNGKYLVEEIQNLRKKENIHCHLRNNDIITLNQFLMTTVEFCCDDFNLDM